MALYLLIYDSLVLNIIENILGFDSVLLHLNMHQNQAQVSQMYLLPHFWVGFAPKGLVLPHCWVCLPPEGLVFPHFWVYMPPKRVILPHV